MSCSKDSTRLGSFAPSRLLRIEPLEDRRLLEFEVTMVAEASVPSGLHGIES